MVVEDFIYESLPTRVVFGDGKPSTLSDEINRLGASRVLILSAPHQTEMAHGLVNHLEGCCVGLFTEAAMHTPVDVTEKAVRLANDVKADALVSFGGGSTVGLGKAVALHTGLPQIAIPTTYAGSEMTDILGQTEHGVKTTLRHPLVQPKVVIYDVSLTLSLPVAVSVNSGLNAMAHAVEALYALDRNPVVSLVAEEGIRALSEALPLIVSQPRDNQSRNQAQYGAWLCGICLGSAGMALHHKLCHVLGGSFNLPHAEMHAVLLPHTAAYNAPCAPQAMLRVARALQAQDAGMALWQLAHSVGAPMALKDIGMSQRDIDSAVTLVMQKPYWNPRRITYEGIRYLLSRAWAGEPPQP